MKLSFDWLNDFANFKEIPFDKILEKISLSICEVDEVTELHKELETVVTVKIQSIEKHPKSEKLLVTKAFDGKIEYVVVTGAKNLTIGDIVPLALVGTTLGTKEIKIANLVGIESFGMYGSEKELGIGEDDSGVLILPKDTTLGISIRTLFSLQDKILLIDNKSITHRPDLWSHFGFARELSSQLSLPITFNPFHSKASYSQKPKTKISQTSFAHSYFGSEIFNITIGPSISKIKSRLEKCGIRSINNVVDVSNYLMLEMGQPTHFFDLDKLGSNQTIKVEKGNKESIKLLDGSTKILDESNIVIYSDENAVAVAGIMGGEESSVTDKTQNLFLESAVFPRELIRLSTRKIGIRSEASMRYEKGLNPRTPVPVIARAMELLKENGAGEFQVSEPIGFTNHSGNSVYINTSFDFLNRKLGKIFPKELILEKLHKLGFETKEKENILEVKVPEWRDQYDIQLEEDILEEVGRSIGYAEVGKTPTQFEIKPALLNECRALERKIKLILSQNFSWNEVNNYPFASKEDTQFERNISSIEIKNPMPNESKFLRTSPYPSILRQLSSNIDRFEEVKLFELGRVYHDREVEDKFLSFAKIKTRKKDSQELLESDFLELRDELSSLFELLNFPKLELRFLEKNYFHPKASLEFHLDGKIFAEIGILHPKFLDEFGIKKSGICLGKLFIENIFLEYEKNKNRFQFQQPSQFPQASLDISIVLNDLDKTDLFASKVLTLDIPELDSIHVASIFKGGNLKEDQKSVTYRLKLTNYKETFTMNELNRILENILTLAKKEGYETR
ncbi:MAG: phenylalanine--tRNA ligase subunit beta [Leptospiraceae bacterium]|nr:phenylalanine--tRNA ligase subunit beta [Leptospiraceae bacterium]